MERCNGKGDPMYHFRDYMMQMMVKNVSPVLKCQGFYLTLDRPAKTWYSKLSLGLIKSWPQSKQDLLGCSLEAGWVGICHEVERYE